MSQSAAVAVVVAVVALLLLSANPPTAHGYSSMINNPSCGDCQSLSCIYPGTGMAQCTDCSEGSDKGDGGDGSFSVDGDTKYTLQSCSGTAKLDKWNREIYLCLGKKSAKGGDMEPADLCSSFPVFRK